MKDLKITFVKDGKTQVREFDTLMDFTTYYELSTDKVNVDDPINLIATFFEKPILNKKFTTLAELYDHCRKIMF